MKHIFSTLSVVLTTILVCSGLYTTAVWAFAQAVTPDTANGSLIRDADGKVIGSVLIAQNFTSERYFWPRPSAANYNGAGAAGSNLSPTNPAVTERAQELIARHGASGERPIPPDLVTASGSGLDPHISLEGAIFQAPRVARARGLSEGILMDLIEKQAQQGGLSGFRYVNVLKLNIALDALEGASS